MPRFQPRFQPLPAANRGEMFAQTFQAGLVSLLYSVGPRPLQLCEKREETPGRSVRRVLDEDVQSAVIELRADNLSRTWLRFPPGASDGDSGDDGASLHLRLRFLVLVLKNVGRDVSLEVLARDDRGRRRRLRASTFQRRAHVHAQLAHLPLRLDAGWNSVQLDLAALLRAAYGDGARYAHTDSVTLHASCRVRRVFFSDRPAADEYALPVEFRLFKRLTAQQAAAFRQQQTQFESKQEEQEADRDAGQ